MKKICILLLSLAVLSVQAQNSYQKHFLTNGYSDIRGIASTDNEGYILTGLDKTNSDPEGDMFAMRIHEDGSIVWMKHYGFKKEDGGNHLLKLNDNNFLITGHTDYFGEECNGYLVKIDQDGNKIWSLVTGDSIPDDVLYASIEDSDGNIYSVGRTEGYGAEKFDVWLSKTDKNGQPVFQKHFGSSVNEIGTSICFTTDNNIILAGNSYDSINYQTNFFYLKCTKDGQLIWSKTTNRKGNNLLYKVLQTDNGTALFGQQSDSIYGLQAYAALCDNAGNITKEKTFGLKGIDIILSAKLEAKTLYCLGYTTSYNDTAGDVFLLKTDLNLNISSINFYGTNQFDQCRDFEINVDGSMTMAGKSKFQQNNISAYIIQTDSKGSLGVKNNVNSNLSLYPNPGSGIFNITGNNLEGCNLNIYNASGINILQTVLISNPQSIDLSMYPTGLYLIRISGNDDIFQNLLFDKY